MAFVCVLTSIYTTTLVEVHQRIRIRHHTVDDLSAVEVDRALTAMQQAENRFGGPKKPNALAIEIEKATTLRGINSTLTGIYDV